MVLPYARGTACCNERGSVCENQPNIKKICTLVMVSRLSPGAWSVFCRAGPTQMMSVHVELDRRQSCILVISCSPLDLIFIPQLSANLWSIALLHQPFFIVRLAQNHVVLEEKFVSYTKPAQHREDRRFKQP